eukprot:4785368-Pyramimonas_sp.AAC.1
MTPSTQRTERSRIPTTPPLRLTSLVRNPTESSKWFKNLNSQLVRFTPPGARATRAAARHTIPPRDASGDRRGPVFFAVTQRM